MSETKRRKRHARHPDAQPPRSREDAALPDLMLEADATAKQGPACCGRRGCRGECQWDDDIGPQFRDFGDL